MQLEVSSSNVTLLCTADIFIFRNTNQHAMILFHKHFKKTDCKVTGQSVFMTVITCTLCTYLGFVQRPLHLPPKPTSSFEIFLVSLHVNGLNMLCMARYSWAFQLFGIWTMIISYLFFLVYNDKLMTWLDIVCRYMI